MADKKKSRFLSTPAWISYILLLVGITLLITILIFFVLYKQDPTPWYYWLILALGLFLTIVGFLIMIFALKKKK